MNWFLVDERTITGTDIFEEKLNVTTREEAIKAATREWYRMAPTDRKHRTDFYIGQAETDEDGNIIYESMRDYTDVLEIVNTADRIKNSGTWEDSDCRTLCGFADMEQEWDEADSENFEQVKKCRLNTTPKAQRQVHP